MKKIFYTFIFLSAFQFLNAQQIGLNFESFPGVAYGGGGGYFYGGGGFELAYQHDFKQGRIRGGLEYRIVDWGNQTGINAAYNHPYYVRGQWRVSGSSGIQLGLALFRERPLFAWALEYSPELEWQSNKRFFANMSFGIRYTNSPKYKNYGKINAVLELPVKIGFGFRLGSKPATQ